MAGKRTVAVVTVGLLAGGAAAAWFLDPGLRLQALASGQPTFAGKAAAAWERQLTAAGDIAPAQAQSQLAAGKGDAVGVCRWLLARPNADTRRRAADALRQMGADAGPAADGLVTAMADPDPLVRDVAGQAVEGLAPHPELSLVRLTARFPERHAVRAVAKFGPAAAEAIPRLRELIPATPDVPTRRQLIRAVGKIGPPAAVAVPDLIVLASDPESGIREQAAEALGDIGPPAAAAVPVLEKLLADPTDMTRRDAVRALGQIGPAAEPALDGVKKLQADPVAMVKDAATRAARLIDPTAGK